MTAGREHFEACHTVSERRLTTCLLLVNSSHGGVKYLNGTGFPPPGLKDKRRRTFIEVCSMASHNLLIGDRHLIKLAYVQYIGQIRSLYVLEIARLGLCCF